MENKPCKITDIDFYNTKELRNLIKKNPRLPIVAMINLNDKSDEPFSICANNISCRIDNMLTIELEEEIDYCCADRQKCYTDESELEEDLSEHYDGDDKKVEKRMKYYKKYFKKVIILYVE